MQVTVLQVVAQREITVTGLVIDSLTRRPLPGVHVMIEQTNLLTTTDTAGNFQLTLTTHEKQIVHLKYVGYTDKYIQIDPTANNCCKLKVVMEEDDVLLGRVVVTASRSEQRLSEVSVSMSVIGSKEIQSLNTNDLKEVFDQIPGLIINRHQVNIRGGSGWSFGAGSRVLVLVDDLPMLSADANDIKWSALPLENASRIEVLKGAASGLYGGSALNGVINIYTADPGDEPSTTISMTGGMYDDPRNESYYISENPLKFGKFQFLHARKIKNADLVVSGLKVYDQGFRVGENNDFSKIFVKLKRRALPNKKWTYGVNFMAFSDTGSNFMYWKSSEEPYLPSPSTASRYNNKRVAVDPHLSYRGNNNGLHTVVGRYYGTDNANLTSQSSKGELFYGEYKYRRIHDLGSENSITWNHGLVVKESRVTSPELYGNHRQKEIAGYLQLNQRIKRFRFSFGSRLERYSIDSIRGKVQPIFRSGVTYQYRTHTWFRGSIGQGIRFPSIAEKFTQTQSGSVRIFPNPSLLPESGWSSELGLKQGYKIGRMKGFVDLAAYWTEYHNMIEFTFGNYEPPAGFGFSAVNVTDARIYGFEFETSGSISNNGNMSTDFRLGYNYNNPLDMNYGTSDADTVVEGKFLKYRSLHNFKLSINQRWKKMTLGFRVRYTSFMVNIDESLNIIVPGVKSVREINKKGNLLLDANIGYQVNSVFQVGIYMRNLTNREYMVLPGNFDAPRSFSLLLKAAF